MITNVTLRNIIDGIPNRDYIRDNWTFTILRKNSASPTLIFLANEGRVIQNFVQGPCPNKLNGALDGLPNGGVCIKTWCDHRARTDEEGGLDYEKRVYSQIIRQILNEDPARPFLRYLGDDNNCTTVGKLAVFLGLNDPNGIQMNLIKLAFFVCNFLSSNAGFQQNFLQDFDEIDFLSPQFYRAFFSIIGVYGQDLFVSWIGNDNSVLNIFNWKIGGIITTRMGVYNKFLDIMNHPNMIGVFREIVMGLYIINRRQLVHNDIHPGNIMVENYNQPNMRVLIYDWDRAYSPILGDNPFLKNNTALFPCDHSQCNIFIPGRPIDLLKVLVYFSNQPAIFNNILLNGLRIQNYPGVYNQIRNGIRTCSPGNDFYNYLGQSSLYRVGLCAELEQAINLLGTWDIIYNRAFPVDDPMDVDFAFKRRKGRVSKNENSDKYILRDKKMSSEMRKKYLSMKKQFKKNKTNFLTEEKKDKLDKLLKIPLNELTWVKFFEIENLINYMNYGPPEPLEEMPVFNFKKVAKPQPFWEILRDNENRKGNLEMNFTK